MYSGRIAVCVDNRRGFGAQGLIIGPIDTVNRGNKMRQYHRLMRRRSANDYTDRERTELFQLLESAPGIRDVEIIDKHPKGGYSTCFDLSPDVVDNFFAYLDDRDWMSVL